MAEVNVVPLSQGNDGTLRTTVPLLVRLIRKSRRDPCIRRTAELICGICGQTTEARIETIFGWVRDSTSYISDPNDTEWVTSPKVLLDRIATRTAFEDCESLVALTASLLESIGIDTRLVLVQTNPKTDEYTHVFLEARNGDEWIGLDPTPPHREAGQVQRRQRGRLMIDINGPEAIAASDSGWFWPCLILGGAAVAIWWFVWRRE